MIADWRQQAQTWWRGLQARERTLVAAGGAAAALLLFFFLLWVPLHRDLDRLRVEVPKASEQLATMRVQAMRVKQLRGNAPAQTKGGGLLSFVEQSATTFNIRQHIKQVAPEGNNAVRLVVDGVPFNTLVTWLANLHKQGGIRIDNATLEPQPTAGLVNARLLLRGAGA